VQPEGLQKASAIGDEPAMAVQLPYLGDRNYIHGTSIVEMIFEEFEPKFPLQVKFHSPIRGVVDVRKPSGQRPNVEVLFGSDEERVSYGLFDLGNGELNNRVPFNECALATDFTAGERSVASRHGADASLISRVVVMNKALVAKVFPDARGKWWFASLSVDAWPRRATSVELEYAGGLGTKLARSSIRVDGEPVGDIHFSLTEDDR
jgi:hypothetical protein